MMKKIFKKHDIVREGKTVRAMTMCTIRNEARVQLGINKNVYYTPAL